MTRGGGGGGLRAKFCHGPRATLILPLSLSVVLVVLMPIAKDRKRAPITPPVGELHQLSEIWGPRANYTFGAPVNHNYPPPLCRQICYPPANLYLPALLELGARGKLLPMPPSLMGGRGAAPVLS
jgi:hypothetical protein